MLVCDSFGVSDSDQAALHVVNKQCPSLLLYSLTITCDRRGTHAQMSRGVLSGRPWGRPTCPSLGGHQPSVPPCRSPCCPGVPLLSKLSPEGDMLSCPADLPQAPLNRQSLPYEAIEAPMARSLHLEAARSPVSLRWL